MIKKDLIDVLDSSCVVKGPDIDGIVEQTYVFKYCKVECNEDRVTITWRNNKLTATYDQIELDTEFGIRLTIHQKWVDTVIRLR